MATTENTKNTMTTEVTVVKETTIQKNLSVYDKNVEIRDNGISIPVDVTEDNKTVETALIPSDFYGIGDMNGVPKSMAEYTTDASTISKDLKKALENLDKARFMIRLGVVNIGKQLFIINSNRSYKVNAAKLGLNDKTWKTFVEEIIGIPVSTSYRYMDVYRICSDAKGNIDKRIVALTDTQLYALRSAGAKYEHISALLDTIDMYEQEPEKIPALVSTVTKKLEEQNKKPQNKTKAKAETEAETEAKTETETETETETDNGKSITFKGALTNQKAIRIPEKIKSSSVNIIAHIAKGIANKKILGDIFKEGEFAEIEIDVSFGKHVDYIIIHKRDMTTILTYYRKHTEYPENK